MASAQLEDRGGPPAWSFEVPWSAITDKPGEMVGRSPASGGFGDVYQGTYNAHTSVALKRLKSDDAGELQSEFAFMRSLPPHDRITPVYGITTDPSTRQPWLVMAWYPLDLQRLFMRPAEQGGQPLSLGKKLEIALELAEGLLFLHSHGVVHRDVKPDNILLTRNFRVKITDFGMSKEVAPGGELSMAQGQGNPLWLAPELQAFHGPKPPYTEAVDVYSWGVIFCQLISTLHRRIYELLTPELITLGEGRPPWNQQLRGRQLLDPEALRQLPALLLDRLPDHLEPMPPALRDAALGLARDCLSLEPGRRPGMGEVVGRVRKLIAVPVGPPAWGFEVPWSAIQPGEMSGAGGFGQVFRATYNSHTKVALKRLWRDDPEHLQREFAFMRSLPPHDRITPVYGITSDPSTGQQWLVMAWYPLDLHRLFSGPGGHGGQPLGLGKKLEIALELAEGLHFLHANGIVHRNINPDNVLLQDDLRVKIAGFDISRILGPDGKVYEADGHGAPLWMAPELTVCIGTHFVYTQAVDVYAWGIVFCQLISTLHHRIYELLTPELIRLEEGRAPWLQQLLGLQLSAPEALRQLPALLVDKLPPHLEPMPPALRDAALGLARDCLSLEPGRRPGMAQVVGRVAALLG